MSMLRITRDVALSLAGLALPLASSYISPPDQPRSLPSRDVTSICGIAPPARGPRAWAMGQWPLP